MNRLPALSVVVAVYAVGVLATLPVSFAAARAFVTMEASNRCELRPGRACEAPDMQEAVALAVGAAVAWPLYWGVIAEKGVAP